MSPSVLSQEGRAGGPAQPRRARGAFGPGGRGGGGGPGGRGGGGGRSGPHDRPRPARAPNPARPRPGEPDTTAAATAALTGLTLAVAFGFARLFDDAGFLGPVLVTSVAVHAAAWACRRGGLGTLPAAVACAGATALSAVWTVLPGSTAWGVPSPESLRQAGDALARASDAFNQVVAPAAVLPGFVLATVLAVGISAFMADWAAFRINATFEPCIPAFTLFLFTAALGSDRHRTWAVALFVAAATVFLLLHELSLPGRASAWFGGRAATGPPALVRTGAALAALALGAGLAVGPRLPGAGDPAVVSYKNRTGEGDSDRATVSPLVDIRGRLVERSGIEVFTVSSPERAYWRLTSLDTFDGAIWSSNDTYRRARGELPSDVGLGPAASELLQEFEIGALGSIWLPAAYRPEQVSGLRGVSWNADTGSLITSDDLTDGLRYRVRSEVVDLQPDQLAQAPPTAPPAVAERYLSLPRVPRAVVAEANRITRDAPTPYARALAIQNHFQSGAFTYDLSARPGHDARAIETFLLATRRGYCEQFAGTFAVLARLSGLPARVAVGFTPGELQADGRYHVRDEHAHAWPEVYLEGSGWVAFEPTPGRGAPGAEDYTGLPEAQDAAGAATTATTVPPTPTTVAGEEAGPTTVPEDESAEAVPAGPEAEERSNPLGRRLLLAAGVVLFLAAAWAVGVPLLARRRRRRRRAAARAPGARVLAAWEEAEEALALAGVARRPSETLTEYARRAPRTAGLDVDTGDGLRQLASDATAACYAGAEPDPGVVAAADAASAAVVRGLDAQAGWGERARRRLDPRPLLPGGRRPRRRGDPTGDVDRAA